MSQLRSNLGHYWNVARSETNYSLFGNSKGRTVAKDWIYEMAWRERMEWRRMDRWWVRFCVKDWRGKNKRQADEAWLRFKEFEQ